MQALTKAWDEFECAKNAFDNLKRSDNPAEQERNWLEFLRRFERAWNKAAAHLKRSPKYQGWPERGRVEKLRRSDPLLAYLKNARGADEHSIDEIAEEVSGGIGINPVEGNSLQINEMTIGGGQIRIRSPQSIRIDRIKGGVKLLPIRNRGRSYSVPKTHLGKDLPDQSPAALAEHGLEFLEAYLQKADAEFVK